MQPRPRVNPKWNIGGKASIAWFHFGDSYLTTLAQETTSIDAAFEGYDYKVLLKQTNRVGPFEVSAGVAAQADEVLEPGRDALLDAIVRVAEKGYMIDLWIFAHGYREGIAMPGDNLTGTVLRDRLGKARSGRTSWPIRLVYQMNCWGSTLGDDWAAVGAKAVTGARYVNFYPNQYGRFVSRWNEGATVATALSEADTASSRTVVQAYILTHAVATRDKWGSCALGDTVLGSSPCAKDYFQTSWTLKDTEWQGGRSGKDNMNHASEKLVVGAPSLVKGDSPIWYR